jgi:photosystem II stability/assembly factor-like uncharacterized protein
MNVAIVWRCAAFAAIAILFGGCGAFQQAPPRPPLLSAPTTQLTVNPGYSPGLPLPPGPIAIGSLRMMTPLRGWALGPPGKGKAGSFYAVLATVDGGTHWRNVTPPQIAGFVDKAVFFLDLQHAWVAVTPHIVSQPAPTILTVFRTADGGISWQGATYHLSDGTPSQLDFVDGLHGWMVLQINQGDAIYRTADAGLSWQLATTIYHGRPGQVQVGSLRFDYVGGPGAVGCNIDPFNLITFRDPSVGWATGGCIKSSLYFFRTEDGGRSWHRQMIPDGSAYYGPCQCDVWTSSPVFTSPADGSFMLTVSTQTTFCQKDAQGVQNCRSAEHVTRASVYVSHDGGSSWTPYGLPETGDLARPPVFVDARSGWFTTYKAGSQFPTMDKLYTTQDGGLTWRTITVSAPAGTLDFVSDQVGWSFDPFGQPAPALFATKDSGRTWQALDTELVN